MKLSESVDVSHVGWVCPSCQTIWSPLERVCRCNSAQKAPARDGHFAGFGVMNNG